MILHCQITAVNDLIDEKTKKPTTPGWCATCPRCGHSETVAVTEGTRTRVWAMCLELLRENCPGGETNKYVRRVIPAGVKLWFHHPGTDRLYPLEVTGRTVHALSGPVAYGVAVYVVPDSNSSAGGAAEFAEQLRAWGYAGATTRPAGFTLPQPQDAACRGNQTEAK